MKGFVAISTHPPAKRWWRASAVVVLVLVFFSLLVPLDFLLGLHLRFSTGYLTDDRQPSEPIFRNFGNLESGVGSFPQGDGTRIEKLVKRFGTSISKDFTSGNHISRTGEHLQKKPVINSTRNLTVAGRGTDSNSQVMNLTTHSELGATSRREVINTPPTDIKTFTSGSSSAILPTPQEKPTESLAGSNTKLDNRDGKNSNAVGGSGEEIKTSCQFKFGSYCLWSVEHKEVMKDSTTKKLKDQLFVVRTYYPSIAKFHEQQKLTQDLKQNIQEHERMLSDAIVDAVLPTFVEKKIQKMEETIAKAKEVAVDCNNVDKKLRQILDLTEDEDSKNSHSSKLDNPDRVHYVIFSKNILAASVTINSTAMNSEVNNMVFHVITDAQNYYAMKLWFGRNSYRDATIKVINFEKLKLNDICNIDLAKLSLAEEFRVSIQPTGQPTAQMISDYISVFGHSHFLLPEIFKGLNKVVILDDGMVALHDPSSLWNLEMEGKVNGAVEFCGLRFGQLKTLLGSNSYDANSCAWMSGLNVIDLEMWRQHNITGVYFQLLESFQTKNEASLRAAALPASLLAFKNLIHPLDEKWSLPGLGHNYGVSADAISSSTSLHYNGNMKPWLDLGIPKYKSYWKKFLPSEERFMEECNVNP